MGFTSGGYTMQRGLSRAQFRKLETVASRLSHCGSLLRKPLFPAKWIISELPVTRGQSREAQMMAVNEVTSSRSCDSIDIQIPADDDMARIARSHFVQQLRGGGANAVDSRPPGNGSMIENQ